MIKDKLLKLTLCSVLAFSALQANSEISSEEKTISTNTSIDADQNEISSASADDNFKDEDIFTWIEEFEDSLGVSIGEAKNGRTFFAGTAVVKVNPTDPTYAKELVIAYEKALLDLQAQFIMQTYGRAVTKTILDFYENDSTNAAEFDPAPVKAELQKSKNVKSIVEKFLAVVDKKLDVELKELGVDEEELQRAKTIQQQKQLFRDNFSKSMVKKAVQNISGLVPVQTKVVTQKTKVGDAIQIGVIAVMSQKTVQFAKDIAKRRTTHIKGKPKNIKDVLPKNRKDYLNEFGLRYLYDEQGRPMLLSYGRWSVVGQTKNPSKYLRKVQSAQDKARMFAEASIGEFMKRNIQATQSVDVESLSEEIAEKTTEINVTRGEVTAENENVREVEETIDRAFKKISAKSKFKLRGTSQIKRWKQEDENGILHVGSVVTWTYTQLENANNIAKKQFKKNSEIKKQNKVAKEVSNKSRIVNDVNDF